MHKISSAKLAEIVGFKENWADAVDVRRQAGKGEEVFEKVIDLCRRFSIY